MAEVVLRIDGMHCGSCVRRVSQALAPVEGIAVEEVRIGAARLQTLAPNGDLGAAVAALAKVGYTAHVERG